jgi:spermidine synthase
MQEKQVSYGIDKRVSTLVLVCFFLSGATGLIYEILWTRLIVKVVGAAPFKISIILTVFMGGLGLGSYIASRVIDRIKNPLKLVRIYGALELMVGAYGLLLPLLLKGFLPIYAQIYNRLYEHFMLYNLLTFVGCFLVLIIPATCMGATLPVLCRFYVSRLSHLGSHAGMLYGLNTIGAALGALLCGFWLINLLGVYGTLGLAVVINGLVGAVSITASYKVKHLTEQREFVKPSNAERRPQAEEAAKETADKPVYKGEAAAALIIFGIGGFCAMAYEVIWTRLLGLIIGPITYSFTIVLVTFITALALGSMVFGRVADRVKRPVNVLIFTQVLAGFLALFVSHILGNSQFFFAKLIYQFQESFGLLYLLKAVILFLFMFLPVFLLGAKFPLVVKIYTQSVSKVGGSIGFAYTVNTIGAVLGSFCAGFVLNPFLGKEDTLTLISALQIATGLVLAAYLQLAGGHSKVRLIPIGAVAIIAVPWCIYFPSWNRTALAMGRYHRMEEISEDICGTGWVEALLQGPQILDRWETGKVVYYGDGIGGFVSVLQRQDAFGNDIYSLLISGKADASSRVDMPTQTLAAHLAMIFHKNPRSVMVLGLASGISAGEVLCYPIERLDVLEISQEVVEASRFFEPWNNKILSDPRTDLIIQDGRAHLQLTERRYDVISSEPSNPWMRGLAALFTRDFFALAKERLNEDGIFVQFVHSYQMDWPTFSMVLRTFAEVFPNSVLMRTRPGDYQMIGFKGERGLELANAERNLRFAQRSRNVRLPCTKLFYRFVVTEDLAKLCGKGPVNSDAYPELEFAAPKTMYRVDPSIEANIYSRAGFRPQTEKLVMETFTDVDMQLNFAEFSLSVNYLFPNMIDLPQATDEQKERFYRLMETYCASNPVDFSIFKDKELVRRCRQFQIDAIKSRIDALPNKLLSYSYLAGLLKDEGKLDEAIAYYSDALQIEPNDMAANFFIGQALVEQGKFEQALGSLDRALKARPCSADIHENLAYTLVQLGRLDEAIDHFTQAVRIRPDSAKTFSDFGLALAKQDRFVRAVRCFHKAMELDPKFAEAYSNLGYVFLRQGELSDAVGYYNEALKIEPNSPATHSGLAYALVNMGRLTEAEKHYIEAVRIDPNYAQAHYDLGVVFARQGRYDKAAAQFKRTLELKPDYPGASESLAKAQRLLQKPGGR